VVVAVGKGLVRLELEQRDSSLFQLHHQWTVQASAEGEAVREA